MSTINTACTFIVAFSKFTLVCKLNNDDAKHIWCGHRMSYSKKVNVDVHVIKADKVDGNQSRLEKYQ